MVTKEFLSNSHEVKAYSFLAIQKVLESLSDSPWTYEKIRHEISKLLTTTFTGEELTIGRMNALRFSLWEHSTLSLQLRVDLLMNHRSFRNTEIAKDDYDSSAVYVGSIGLILDRGNLGGVCRVEQQPVELGEKTNWKPTLQLIDQANIAPPQDKSFDPKAPLTTAIRNLLGPVLLPYAMVFEQQESQPINMAPGYLTYSTCYVRNAGPNTTTLRPDQHERYVQISEGLQSAGFLSVDFVQESFTGEMDNPVGQRVYALSEIFRLCTDVREYLLNNIVPPKQRATTRSVVIEEVAPNEEYQLFYNDPDVGNPTGFRRGQKLKARELSTLGFDVMKFFFTPRSPFSDSN